MLAMSLLVAQWLECPTGVRKVMGSIPVGDSNFFFVPHSRHAEYSIFSYFFSELKIHHLSFFINNILLPFTARSAAVVRCSDRNRGTNATVEACRGGTSPGKNAIIIIIQGFQ